MKNKRERLQNSTLFGLASSVLHHEGSASGMLKDFLDTLVGFGRALEVLLGTNLLSNGLTLVSGDWALGSSLELLNGLGIVTEIGLAANENDGDALAEVQDFGDPLLLDVVKGIGGVNGEADKDDVGIRV